MGILSKYLMRKYKQGLLPPQMGAQLIHPRRLIMYDTFNRPATTVAQGIGESDSGHIWETKRNGAYIQAPGRVKNSGSGDRTILTVDIGGLQDNFSITANLRSSRGGARHHGVLVAYVDNDNYVWVGTEVTNLQVKKVVSGEETVLASVTRPDGDGADYSFENITVIVTNPWGDKTSLLRIRTDLSGLAYSLNSDIDVDLWEGNILPGLVFPHNSVYCSAFYITDEGIGW